MNTAKITYSTDKATGRVAVLRNGEKIGEVYQEEVSTVRPIAGRMYGSAGTRKRWAWSADDMGINDFPSRKAAVTDMLDFV